MSNVPEPQPGSLVRILLDSPLTREEIAIFLDRLMTAIMGARAGTGSETLSYADIADSPEKKDAIRRFAAEYVAEARRRQHG